MPVNALIALCHSGGSYPEILGSSGYYVAGIEVPVQTADGTVVIDVVMFQPERNVILAGEAKSGANVDDEQARRYGGLRADAVIQAASINVRSSNDRRIQSLYCCPSEKVGRVMQGLQAAGLACPVLAFSTASIKHHGATFIDQALKAKFAQPVPVPGRPPRIIPVDDESPDYLFDRLVAAGLVRELSRQRAEVSVPLLAEQAIPHLPIYGSSAQAKLVKKIDAAARRVVNSDSATFEYLPKTGTRGYAVVRFLRSPEEAAPQGRTQGYQAITRSYRRRSQAQSASDGTQMRLFDEMMGEFLQADGIMARREDEA